MSYRNIHFVCITILILLVASCQRPSEGGESEEASTEESQESEQVFAVITTPVQEGLMIDYMELSGSVQAINSVDLLAETSGEITRVFVDVGDKVARNGRVVRIDPSRPGQRFEVNDVTSSISGTVIALPLKVGSKVNPGVPVAQVAETNELEIVTYVAERFVSRVEVGQGAIVTLDAYPGDEFDAQVSAISPVLNEQSRTLELKLLVQDPDNQLRAGMFASLQLILERKPGVMQIPLDAVTHRFGRELVYVVNIDRETVAERVVSVGLEIDEKVEILEGLAPDEEIVYQGQTFLTDGAKIQIIDTVSPTLFEE